MARKSRVYVRDASGQFASTPGGGSKGAKRGRTELVRARRSVRQAKRKLAGFDPADQSNKSALSRRAQRGAVTKAQKRLAAVKKTAVIKGARVGGTIAKPKGLKPGALTARLQAKQAASGGRKRNLRAERAKAAANRTGVVSGKNFTHGQDVKTMSLAELRTAVRQHSRKGGPMSRKEFMYLYALPSGVVSTGKNGMEKGRMPRTRGDWEKIYKSVIGLPQAERNRKNRPGMINGIDIHGSFRPGAVFGLSMKTATPDDVNRAYRRLARQAHPDAGGRRRDFERLTQMRDSVLALMRDGGGSKSKSKSKSKGKGKGAAAPAAAAPRGPRMLPPAAQVPAAATGKPKQSRGGKAAAKPASAPAKPKRSRGGKVRMPRMATPAGAIRKSDLAKVKADAKTGIGTPMSRAAQRAFARSAREAPLVRKQAIAAAKRKGVTGFGKGPQMNTRSIGNSAFNWNRNEQPATARERLAMWQKSERRNRGFWSGSRGVAGAYAGELRASRRAAALVDSGDRRGNLPTTRKMAEQPRQRRVDRVSRNETQGRLAASDANRRLLPQIQKVRDAAQKRITEGKKPTAAQREKERKLVGEYNKQARKLQVAQAAKAYMENPWGFTPQRMSGSRRSAGVTEPAKPRPARSAGEGGKRKRKAS